MRTALIILVIIIALVLVVMYWPFSNKFMDETSRGEQKYRQKSIRKTF